MRIFTSLGLFQARNLEAAVYGKPDQDPNQNGFEVDLLSP